MCPPRTDQTKIDTTRTDGTEIEVKPPESCLTYQLQVISCSVIITGSICMQAKNWYAEKGFYGIYDIRFNICGHATSLPNVGIFTQEPCT